ncbi:MAG: Holo-(acyl-carrier-protein) synthase [Candidatus Omnitrophica bacterium ADurb.Bin277]|nr:MAG: Holo-(acyl-carrier-protein) synthase [Candidatus Omnitrophica bacterium ADurb.Bin277]
MRVLQGVNLVEISKLEASVKRQKGISLKRMFTPAERDYCAGKRMKFEHYAARLAAKKAFLQAVGINLKKKDAFAGIEVRNEPSGKPRIELSPRIRKIAGIMPEDQIELSLAHEREYAIATVVIVKR